MKTIRLENKEINLSLDLSVKESWNELSLGDYFRLVDGSDGDNETLKVINIASVISGCDKEDLMDMPESELDKLSETFTDFGEIGTEYQRNIMIDNVMYVVKDNMSDLSSREKIFISEIQKEKKSFSDTYLGILAILVRPGYLMESEGTSKYVMCRLDMGNLEDRKKLILDRLSVKEAVPIMTAFMNGTRG